MLVQRKQEFYVRYVEDSLHGRVITSERLDHDG
jgi:hypothetical protein